MRNAIGLADLCEVMTRTFSFPEEGLAAAVAGGSFCQDFVSCLADAGRSLDVCASAAETLSFGELDPACLADRLRKGYSILFLAPGGEVPVWPYESAFRFVAAGCEGVPSLFRSATTVDVERHMRDAGVLPKDARIEPADSVWSEFSFMSYLYGNVAKALYEGRKADAAEWSGRIVRFWDEHASKWIPDFMAKAIEEAPGRSYGVEYAPLAKAGLLALDAIRDDVEPRRAEV